MAKAANILNAVLRCLDFIPALATAWGNFAARKDSLTFLIALPRVSLMLELVLFPDERLHKISSSVENINGEIKELVDQMMEIMHQGGGIGLAGVQVGRMESLFVVHVLEEAPLVFINPEITSCSDNLVPYEEGCLSIPGVYAEVMRPDAIELRAWNQQGEEFTMETRGVLARVIQHEYDHLRGVLFYEHLKRGMKKRLLATYEKSRNQ